VEEHTLQRRGRPELTKEGGAPAVVGGGGRRLGTVAAVRTATPGPEAAAGWGGCRRGALAGRVVVRTGHARATR